MKINTFFPTLLIILFSVLTHSAVAEPWKACRNDEERAFYTEQMDKILKIYRTGDFDAALAEVERADERIKIASSANRNYSVYFFHRLIWWEAQTQSGQKDPYWGSLLFEYLYERDVLKNGEIQKIPPSDYLLIGNIISSLEETGRAAEARSWALHLEDNICKYRGLSTSNTAVYADEGPLFSFIPEARKRAFPYYRHELPEIANTSPPRPLYYPYIYAIQYIANDALASGDWVRAAELYAWYLDYTDQYIVTRANTMRNEVFANNLQAIESLASICIMHNAPEQIIPMYDTAIEQMRMNTFECSWTIEVAKLEREAAKIKVGTITEDAMGIADRAVDKLCTSIYYSQPRLVHFKLLRARIYHALGHQAEAWATVNNLLETTQKDVNPYLWTSLLTTMIDLAIDDGATNPKLEEWLILALRNERLKGNKFGELPLYEKYAALLMQQGRYEEALDIQREALRLSRAMNLHERALGNEKKLKEVINQTAGVKQNSSDSIKPAPTPLETPPSTGTASVPPLRTGQPSTGATSIRHGTVRVDIQPYESKAVAVKGQASYGRFYLFNPTAQTENGILRISGPINEISWLNTRWMSVGASSQFALKQQKEALTIPPGAHCVIDLIGAPHATEAETIITCEWLPADEDTKASSARWTYSSSSNDTRTAVIDAHAIRENPFYLIPIHHMIQRMETGSVESVDFAIESSAPMRIEVYNSQTEELLCVDANGDGDFKDSGDYIGMDKNRNNLPDIEFSANQKLTSIIMYIRPSDRAGTTEAITVKTLDGEAWRVDAIDQIEFSN